MATAAVRELAATPRRVRALRRGFSSTPAVPSSVFNNKNIKFKSNGFYTSELPVVTVLGATGFIGSHVTNVFSKAGAQMITTYRGDGREARHLKVFGDLGQVVPLPLDMTNIDTIQRAVERSDIVINLIGRQYETANYSYDDVHTKISHRLAKVCKQAGVQRFFQVSTVGADTKSSSSWVRSKALSEQAVKDFYPDATIFRLAPTFGVDDDFLHRYGYIYSMFSAIPTVNGASAKLQPTFVGDVARAIFNAAVTSQSIGKTYELAGPEVMTTKQMLEWMAERLYKADLSVDVPLPLLKAFGKVNEFLPFNYRMMTSDQVERMALDFVAAAGSNGYADLKIQPKSLAESGAASLVVFMNNRGPVRQDLELRLGVEDLRDNGASGFNERTEQWRI